MQTLASASIRPTNASVSQSASRGQLSSKLQAGRAARRGPTNGSCECQDQWWDIQHKRESIVPEQSPQATPALAEGSPPRLRGVVGTHPRL